MIDISADARMLLAENRKTLFKADLILNGNIPSAVGKNLNIHENGKTMNLSQDLTTSMVYYNGTAQGFDISNIPKLLMEKYKYIIFSMDFIVEEFSNPSNWRIGYLCMKDGSMAAFETDEPNAKPIEVGTNRCFGVFHTDSVIADSYDDSATLFTAWRVSSNVTLDAKMGRFMCELNDTGIPSEYADSYVYNGGSYSDFLTAPELSLTGDDVMANTTTFSDSVSSSGSFDIGAAIINSLSLTLNNYDGRFDSIDFTGAALRAYIGIPLAETEWITKGYYTVDKPTSIGNTIPLTMLDNMSKFEKPYSEVAQLYPATLAQILQSICLYCGVVLDSVTFPNSDFEISARPDDANITCLSMVSYVAQIAGCYARVNRFGYLQLKWYDPESFNAGDETYDGGKFDYAHTDNVLDGGKFDYAETGNVVDGGTFNYGEYYSCYAISSFSVGTDDIAITGIKVVVDSDNEIAVGADGYVLEVSDNPLITADNMATVANYLGNKIVGLKFRPFNISALSEPAVEAGDAIRITDRKGNHYDSFITTCSYKYGNYEPFACNAQTVSENNSTSYSPITKAVEKARKDTEKTLSAYDLGVIRMNEIALNAMGYYSSYTESLDGSRISYIHNKPTREESTILWQLSASGFFLSQDGGGTWVSGWDASGNAVFNILYAIGIVCDWIKGGTLTLGGDNNVNGLLRVLNASGTEVCSIDQAGLYAIAADISGKVTATSGNIGGLTLSGNRLFSTGSGFNGIDIDVGKGVVDWSWNNRYGSWSNIKSGDDIGSGKPPNIQFWTGVGGSTGNEGFYITNASYSPGGGMPSWIRVGSQNIASGDKGSVLWSSGSDERIKREITPLEISKIRVFFNRVNPKFFKYTEEYRKNDNKTYFGVVAQEMEEIFEELEFPINNVVTETDDKWKFVNYQELHAFELAGIKDLYETCDNQQAEINDLYETVERQQSEIDELKAQVKYLMERVDDGK